MSNLNFLVQVLRLKVFPDLLLLHEVQTRLVLLRKNWNYTRSSRLRSSSFVALCCHALILCSKIRFPITFFILRCEDNNKVITASIVAPLSPSSHHLKGVMRPLRHITLALFVIANGDFITMIIAQGC